MNRNTYLGKVLRLVTLGFGFALLGPSVAEAQWAFGVRGGLSMTPDAIQVGGHAQKWMEIDGLPGLGRLGIEPSLEIGFATGGADYTTVRVNGNVMIPFALGDSDGLQIHPIAGLGYNRWSISNCPIANFCSFSNIGLNIGGGITFNQRFGIDAYTGLGSIGDLAIMGKMTFGG